MAAATLIPLLAMGVLNYYEHQTTMAREIQNPLRVLVNKTKNSFELFLTERSSTVSLIASAYTYPELADEKKLGRIFSVMKKEFKGFVDLGLIDEHGTQVNYVGPYALKGKNYAEQRWFQEVRIKGKYVSDVFMGFRKFPHVIIAVQHMTEDGRTWILRATLDTHQFERIIASMSLEPDADAFLVNGQGIMQTSSNNYGKVLEKMSFPMPPQTYEPAVLTMVDPLRREVYVAYAYFPEADFALVAVKPRGSVLKTWYRARRPSVHLRPGRAGRVRGRLPRHRRAHRPHEGIRGTPRDGPPAGGAFPEAFQHWPAGRRRGPRNQQSPGHHQRKGRAREGRHGAGGRLPGQGQDRRPGGEHSARRGALPGHHPPHARLCPAHGREL
jgi:hypothetical protein